MLVNLNQYRWTVEVFNCEFMPSTQSNVFYSTFFCDLDILAISSLIFSVFILCMCDAILHLIFKKQKEILFRCLLLMLINLGAKRSSCDKFSICQRIYTAVLLITS